MTTVASPRFAPNYPVVGAPSYPVVGPPIAPTYPVVGPPKYPVVGNGIAPKYPVVNGPASASPLPFGPHPAGACFGLCPACGLAAQQAATAIAYPVVQPVAVAPIPQPVAATTLVEGFNPPFAPHPAGTCPGLCPLCSQYRETTVDISLIGVQQSPPPQSSTFIHQQSTPGSRTTVTTTSQSVPPPRTTTRIKTWIKTPDGQTHELFRLPNGDFIKDADGKLIPAPLGAQVIEKPPKTFIRTPDGLLHELIITPQGEFIRVNGQLIRAPSNSQKVSEIAPQAGSPPPNPSYVRTPGGEVCEVIRTTQGEYIVKKDGKMVPVPSGSQPAEAHEVEPKVYIRTSSGETYESTRDPVGVFIRRSTDGRLVQAPQGYSTTSSRTFIKYPTGQVLELVKNPKGEFVFGSDGRLRPIPSGSQPYNDPRSPNKQLVKLPSGEVLEIVRDPEGEFGLSPDGSMGLIPRGSKVVADPTKQWVRTQNGEFGELIRNNEGEFIKALDGRITRAQQGTYQIVDHTEVPYKETIRLPSGEVVEAVRNPSGDFITLPDGTLIQAPPGYHVVLDEKAELEAAANGVNGLQGSVDNIIVGGGNAAYVMRRRLSNLEKLVHQLTLEESRLKGQLEATTPSRNDEEHRRLQRQLEEQIARVREEEHRYQLEKASFEIERQRFEQQELLWKKVGTLSPTSPSNASPTSTPTKKKKKGKSPKKSPKSPKKGSPKKSPKRSPKRK
eukprot:NODE_747_length_2389_cov_56.090026_g638_i0.p1 GENE.NODE_747_length_2389_cov_56.090026_g638_i0~~NODE_747_length_2389_cov_56.090026_g638_i0.p1  ORF type:complete len:740 (-),score=196.55 NODE_747_length_2389_cov_56.090026_g638_i0:170-2341(-)